MEAYNNDDSYKDTDMVKSEKIEQLTSGNTDDSIIKRYKLKRYDIISYQLNQACYTTLIIFCTKGERADLY